MVLCALWLPGHPAVAAEVAILKSSDLAAYASAVAGFRAELGGNGTIVQEHDLQGDLDEGRKAARRIRASDTTLVLAVGTKAALAAKLELVDTPVIYCLVLDPDKHDLSAPNMSGISLDISMADHLHAMRALFPKLKRIGILFDPAKTERLVRDGEREGKHQGIEIVAAPVSAERDVPTTLRTLLPTVDVLWLLPDTTVLTEDSLAFILQESLEANRPVVGFSAEFVKRGALMSISADYYDIGRQAARLSRRILGHQASPPLRLSPDRIHIAVNYKTARFLGIEIPPDLDKRVDERY